MPASGATIDARVTAVADARDGAAFTSLFNHFTLRLRRHLMQRGVPSFMAADDAQDVMETIWRKAHLFDGSKSAAITWVLHIARNRCIDLGRRSREQICALDDLAVIPDPTEGEDLRIDAGSARVVCAPFLRSCLPSNSASCGLRSLMASPMPPSRAERICRSAA